MKYANTIGLFCFALIFILPKIYAQEKLIPLDFNNRVAFDKSTNVKIKKTRLALPFIEDFSNTGPFPDASKWLDKQVYINNTFSNDQPTKGIATFDGLDAKGRPYRPSPFSSGYADSLTSQPIDLSSYTSLSNIFISFYYQPQGLGFAPEPQDSLILYFKSNTNEWEKVWQAIGSPFQNFELDFVSIDATRFLHTDFQFRFVNIASLNINDDVWNIDYIKIDANRSNIDTNMNDVAFTKPPSSFLFPYTSMPYRHFIANQTNEKAADFSSTVRNNYNNTITFSNNAVAKEAISSTTLNSTILPSVTLGAKSSLIQTFTTFPFAYTPPTPKSKVILNQTYFYPPVNGTDFKRNDTIVRETIFDNHFAYDDGSAEKSYFLFPAANFPSKLAMEFHLNEADTLRGMMVHFGAQAPSAQGKYFSLVLYHSLGNGAIQDSIILQQDLYKVLYDTNIQGFTTYAFTNPTLLQAGTYYMGITQPANFGSDSIYYGFDVNTNSSAQFLHFNVQGSWQSSSVIGSVMIRPIVGSVFTPSAISSIETKENKLLIFPNPAFNILHIESNIEYVQYRIFDLQGSVRKSGKITESSIEVGNLPKGMYFLECIDEKQNSSIQKFVKQDL